MLSGGHITLDVLQEIFKLMSIGILTVTEYDQDHGQVTQFILLNINAPKGTRRPGGDWRRFTRRPGQNPSCQKHGQACQRRLSNKKSKNGPRKKPKLDNGGKLRGVLLHRSGRQKNLTRHWMKNARKKLEMHVGSSVLCKVPKDLKGILLWRRTKDPVEESRDEQEHRERSVAINNKMNRARLYVHTNSMLMRPREVAFRRTHRKGHEDHIAERLWNSMNHCNHAHKPTPIHQAMKILDAKAAIDKEWNWTEKTEKTGHSANFLDFLPSEECSTGETPSKNARGRVVLWVDNVEHESG